MKDFSLQLKDTCEQAIFSKNTGKSEGTARDYYSL